MLGLHRWLSGKESTCNARAAGNSGWIPELERFPWRRKQQPLQYSCLENPVDRGALRATVHRVTKSWTQLKWLIKNICVGGERAQMAFEFNFCTWLSMQRGIFVISYKGYNCSSPLKSILRHLLTHLSFSYPYHWYLFIISELQIHLVLPCLMTLNLLDISPFRWLNARLNSEN